MVFTVRAGPIRKQGKPYRAPAVAGAPGSARITALAPTVGGYAQHGSTAPWLPFALFRGVAVSNTTQEAGR